jgi:tryptophanyl-tRNA synthetase
MIPPTRILTGIQSSGRQHLGNLLGAIVPALEQSQRNTEASFFFIADLHSLTTVRSAEVLQENTLHTAAAWLACGLNTEKDVFYRQSRVPQVTELTWYLNCYTQYPMLANAHSFKDKSENLSNVNAGLFTYPVLMAADIVLYDATHVPVGKDQKQHLEMARDIANAFNYQTGTDTFVLPEAVIQETVMTVPGTDGRKMSKSYGNVINVFAPEKELKKQVLSILSDSKTLEEPKDPSTDTTFALYQLVATPAEIAAMHDHYTRGGYGYGHAKLALLEKLLDRFAEARRRYDELIAHPQEIERLLQAGEQRAAAIANEVLQRARTALGLGR